MEEGRKLVRVGVTIAEEQHHWLKRQAVDLRIKGGASALLRRILDQHIDPAATTAREDARP